MAVCSECLRRTARADTGLCPACEVQHEVYAAQASNQKVYFATFKNLTQCDVKQMRYDGWELVSGTFEQSEWCIRLKGTVSAA
jgi:hypothetical protein